MFSKALSLASMAYFMCQAAAMPVDSSEALRARASSSGIDTVALYSGTSYSGSQYVLSVVQGATEFCEEWTNTNANGFPPLPEVKRYIAANIVCFTFAQSGCGGNATYILDSNNESKNTALSFKSLECGYVSS